MREVIVNDVIVFLLDAGGGLTGRAIDEINDDVYYISTAIASLLLSVVLIFQLSNDLLSYLLLGQVALLFEGIPVVCHHLSVIGTSCLLFHQIDDLRQPSNRVASSLLVPLEHLASSYRKRMP